MNREEIQTFVEGPDLEKCIYTHIFSRMHNCNSFFLGLSQKVLKAAFPQETELEQTSTG